MEIVNKFRQYQRNKKSVRKTLLEYGTRDWTNFTRPLSQLSEEEVATLILNWIPKALDKNETMKLRPRADGKVYEIWFKYTRNIIQVKTVKQRRRNMERMYCWKPNETFSDVTLEDIRQSMALADVINQLN